MKGLHCESCDFNSGNYLEPFNKFNLAVADVIVVLDSPTSHDIREGTYLSRDAGQMFFDVFASFRGESKVHVNSAILCNFQNKRAKTPVASRCYRNHFKAGMDWLRNVNTKEKIILLVGFWPTKLILGKDLSEASGHVIQDGHLRFGVINSPQSFLAKYVRWRKNEEGVWEVTVPGAQEHAKQEWRKHAVPLMQKLFAASDANILTDNKYRFKYTEVSHDELIGILRARKGKPVSFDVETFAGEEEKKKGWSALDWFYGKDCCQIRSMAFTLFDNYAECGYTPGSVPVYDPEKIVVARSQITPILAYVLAETKVVAFNGSYDTGVVYAHSGVRVPIHADPCDMAYVVDQTRQRFGLKSLVYQRIPEVAGYDSDVGKDFEKCPIEDLMSYNAGDVWCSLVLYYMFSEIIQKQQMGTLYWGIMQQAKPYLRDMEIVPKKLNFPVWREVVKDVTQKHDEALKTIKDSEVSVTMFGGDLNPDSPKQLLPALQKATNLPLEGTDKKILEKLEHLNLPFVKALQNYRQAKKVKGIFVDGFPKRWKDGNLWASFRMNTTRTGRTSSGGGDTIGLGKTNQINIQNIPRSSVLRSLFMAREGWNLAYADFGQIEIRVAGAYSRSQEIVDICNSSNDFHGMMTSKAYRVPYEDVMAEDKHIKEVGGTSLRTKGKVVSFGILYGMTPSGLAETLKIITETGEPDWEAGQKLIDDFFMGMPSVKDFVDRTHAFVSKNMFVRTAFGRIRTFEVQSAGTMREAVNTLVQSTASDIFLCAMATCCREFEKRKWYWKSIVPWAEVHDSLTFEKNKELLPDEEVREVMNWCMTQRVREEFSFVDRFLGDIPLAVDFHFGEVWA